MDPQRDPRYTNSGHPYNENYNTQFHANGPQDPNGPYAPNGQYNAYGQYRQGDAPFQFPWWAILIAFMLGMWPVALVFLVLNTVFKKSGQSFRPQQGNIPYTQRSTTKNVYVSQDGTRVRYTTVQTENGSTINVTKTRTPQKTRRTKKKAKSDSDAKLKTLAIVGGVLVVIGLLALPEGLYWLPDALAEGGYYWRWIFEDTMPALISLFGGGFCLFGAHKTRVSRRMRKKIEKVVGKADYMYIQDIAESVGCAFDKCCKYLETCIDDGVFGEDAYLDLRTRCLVVRGAAPKPEPKPEPEKKTQPKAEEKPLEQDRYEKILQQLREVNDAIPDEVMSDKISRLEAVAAKIFAQAKAEPEKLPRIRKFMDYYLPTSLKLLNTYAELDAQGVEGDNIRESKKRIEQTMDTLVVAFERQLDQLFEGDALDVSADIDVMQNMLRADGLTGSSPFDDLGTGGPKPTLDLQEPHMPEPPQL